MNSEHLEGGYKNGNNNDGGHGCGQETDGQQEVFESTTLFIALMNAWIMNDLLWVVYEKIRGEQRQNIYVDNYRS